ncbi:MAG: hypothetical protein K2X93_29195 [Candidatus Obscuribacterales bacterium]|nr:hypothetical protein [Candidatus Obscuribacterales bacterium]
MITSTTTANTIRAIEAPPFNDGFLHAYFVFDVGESIDLGELERAGTRYQRAQLKVQGQVSPRYLQFREAPIAANLDEQLVENSSFRTDLKIYPYGTIVVRFTLDLRGGWEECAGKCTQLRRSPNLENRAKSVLDNVIKEISQAINKAYEPLMEDYFVIHMVSQTEVTSSSLLNECRAQLAALIVGETQLLSPLEEQEVLKYSYSYFESDLTVVHWDSCFILDTVAGAQPILDILEFANTQLVELRYYDNWLDREFDKIYKRDINAAGPAWLHGGVSAAKSAEKLRLMLVDLRELSDEANNALKIMGDAFYARLYRGISSRFGLTNWHEQVESKLNSADQIYRYMIDQAHVARSQFFEIIIIALIAIEILLSLIGH